MAKMNNERPVLSHIARGRPPQWSGITDVLVRSDGIDAIRRAETHWAEDRLTRACWQSANSII